MSSRPPHPPFTSTLANPFPSCPFAHSRPAPSYTHLDCVLVDPLHPWFLSWTEHPLEMGAGTWTMLLYSSFLNVDVEMRFSTCHFHLSVWKCFSCKDSLYTWVCCLLHIFFFLFSHFLSSFVSVLSYNTSTNCWACLNKTDVATDAGSLGTNLLCLKPNIKKVGGRDTKQSITRTQKIV